MKNRKVNQGNLVIAFGVLAFILGMVFVIIGECRDEWMYCYIGFALISPLIVGVLGVTLRDIVRESYNAIFSKQEEK